jgi:DNA-binding LacI/PurR family transcriptional regulator
MKALGDQIPSAYYAANDLMAIGILRALDELHLKVPKDISVIGTNNSYISKHTTPPLTTIEVPYAEIARKAINLLLTQITKNNTVPANYVESCRLIVRESTGTAPKTGAESQHGN